MPVVPQRKQPAALVPYYRSECGRVVVYKGDCREVMKKLEAESIHAIVSDPPYGLEFMGKDWDAPWKEKPPGFDIRTAEQRHEKARLAGHKDGGAYARGVDRCPSNMSKDSHGFQQWFNLIALEMLRVCKPGAHCLTFGGTRMFHRMACAVEDAGWEIRDNLGWIYGSGFPKSHNVAVAIDKLNGVGPRGKAFNMKGRAYQPTTDDAKKWQGFGTALKPAHEIVVCSQKPLEISGEQSIIVGNLNNLENQLWSLLPASVVKKNFESNRSEYDAVCASARWGVGEKSSTQVALSEVMDTSQYETALSSCLNTVRLWRTTLAESSEPMNTFITKTKSSTTIDWKTLRLCSSVLTPLTIIQAAICQPGSWWNALPAAKVLNVVVTNINDTHTLSAAVSAIEKEHTLRQGLDGKRLSPNYEPCILSRKPLIGTVAQNVLEHGTGGINIDGCRVGTDGGCKHVEGTGGFDAGTVNAGLRRWPANIIHDGSDEVVRLFPETTSGGGWNGEHKETPNRAMSGNNTARTVSNDFAGNTGSAARFFYTAKAGGSERDNNTHPTLKPVDLMQYLVRLVAAKESLVMDPFMGSGSTGVACIREGMKFIGIEQSEEYCDIAVGRLKHELVQCGYAKPTPPPAVKVLKVGEK